MSLESFNTLEEAVADYHSRTREDIPYIPSEGNDRLWVHDMLHTILGTSVNNGRGELITGIYQAVLLRDNSCGTREKRHYDHDDVVTEGSLRKEVVTGLNGFMQNLGQKRGFTPKTRLSDENIREHYYKAIALRHLLEKKLQDHGLGDRLGDVPAASLKKMHPSFFTEAVAQAEQTYEKVKRYAEATNAPTVPYP